MSSAEAKFGGFLVLLLLSGCPPPQVPQTGPDRVVVDPRQWQIVEQEARVRPPDRTLDPGPVRS